jgi:photosystem II stability/assembly factor-like uncharacterized protein
VGACGANEDEPTGIDPGPGHVHALGLNPGDRSLFIATHNGLYRLPPDAQRAERVGDRHQDTMGFTVVGRDHFLGSGHPDLRDELPPLLGLIESRDGGETWAPISLLGRADFHALRVHGRRIVGYDATGERVMISDNRGRSWRSGRPPEPLVDLVVDPTSANVFLAAGASRLFVSRDSGRTWSQREQGTGLLAWPRRDRIYLLDGGGRIWLSRDGGARWQHRGQIGSRPAALLAVDVEVLYAATHEGEVKRSSDGGVSWMTRSAL